MLDRMSDQITIEKAIDYQTAVDRGLPSRMLDPETRIEFQAIDLAIMAMHMDPKFQSEFQEHGTDLNTILDGVRDLPTLFTSVAINCGQEMVDAGHIKKWGSNIMRVADNGYGTNGNGEVNKKLRDFVLSESDHFGIEIEEK